MIIELAALITATAALVVSVVALSHQIQQRRNEIRPELVLIERPVSTDAARLCLYLVNMGNAAALRVEVEWLTRPADLKIPHTIQTAVAAGRRIALVEPYVGKRLGDVRLRATYRDLDSRKHDMTHPPHP